MGLACRRVGAGPRAGRAFGNATPAIAPAKAVPAAMPRQAAKPSLNALADPVLLPSSHRHRQ
jgi:hypothetical protein